MAKKIPMTDPPKTSLPLKIAAWAFALVGIGLVFLPTPEALPFFELDYTLFLAAILIVPPALVHTKGWTTRFVIMVTSLALFGFLQMSCMRMPGAMEYILLHATDDKSITMHLMKVGVILAMTLIWSRYYCGFICPKGAIQELLHYRKLRVTVPRKLDLVLKSLKYVVMVAWLVSPLLFQFRLIREIEPFKVIFNLDGPTYLVIILAVTLLASVFVERAHCRYLCPEGALMALVSLASPFKMRVEVGGCTSCKRCVDVCPTQAITVVKGEGMTISSLECITCRECEQSCRYGVIHYGRKATKETKPTVPVVEETPC